MLSGVHHRAIDFTSASQFFVESVSFETDSTSTLSV